MLCMYILTEVMMSEEDQDLFPPVLLRKDRTMVALLLKLHTRCGPCSSHNNSRESLSKIEVQSTYLLFKAHKCKLLEYDVSMSNEGA